MLKNYYTRYEVSGVSPKDEIKIILIIVVLILLFALSLLSLLKVGDKEIIKDDTYLQNTV